MNNCFYFFTECVRLCNRKQLLQTVGGMIGGMIECKITFRTYFFLFRSQHYKYYNGRKPIKIVLGENTICSISSEFCSHSETSAIEKQCILDFLSTPSSFPAIFNLYPNSSEYFGCLLWPLQTPNTRSETVSVKSVTQIIKMQVSGGTVIWVLYKYVDFYSQLPSGEGGAYYELQIPRWRQFG